MAMPMPGKDPVTVCLRCRAVSAGVAQVCPAPMPPVGGPGGAVEAWPCGSEAVEYYETRVEGEARAAGLWFGRLREMRVPERAEDGMARVDYTDPYFKEVR